MAKDYAQRRPGNRQVRPKGVMPSWVWALAGLSLGLAVAAMIYISRPAPNHLSASLPPTKPSAKKPVELPPEKPSRFSFYEMLPSYEVVIPGEAKPKKNGDAKPIAEPGEYLIQVGSFRLRAEAEAQKAKLALLGMQSRVEQVTIDNRDTWFRVRIGPEKDEARVNELMGRLQDNGIEPFLMRVKKTPAP